MASHQNENGTVCKNISDEAQVHPLAYVGPDCQVLDQAVVHEGALVADQAVIQGRAQVFGSVYGRAVVGGQAVVHARVGVFGDHSVTQKVDKTETDAVTMAKVREFQRQETRQALSETKEVSSALPREQTPTERTRP